jgi:DNA-binding MarR family transcriptional regulator
MGQRDGAPERLRADLLQDLERALRTLSKRVYWRPPGGRTTTGHRIDRAGYACLVSLEDCGETRLSELAGRLELDVSTVSRQVRLLEDAKLVGRRPDPLDGRASLLTLTPEGSRELGAQRSIRMATLEDALRDWPENDRVALLTLLDRLSDDVARALTRPDPKELSA